MPLLNFIRSPGLRQGLTVLADQGLLSIATFVVGVLVARGNSQENYGIYVLAWSLLIVAQGIHRALVCVPVTVYLPKTDEHRVASYLTNCLIYTLFAAILMSACVVALLTLKPEIFDLNGTSHGYFSLLLALLLSALLLREFFRNTLLASLSFSASALASILSSSLMLIFSTYFYITGELTYTLALLLFVLAFFAASISMFVSMQSSLKFSAESIFQDLKHNFNLGKWILLNVFAYMGASQAFPWIILFLIDSEAVGIFGACFAVASLLSPLLRAGNAYILPRMSHGYKNGDMGALKHLLNRSLLVLSAPYLLWLIIGLLLQDILVPLFYSDKYAGYGTLFALLLGKVTIENISAPLTNALQALELPTITTTALTLGAVIALTTGPLLIMSYGLHGAGMATILSSLATASWKWYRLKSVISSRCATQPGPQDAR